MLSVVTICCRAYSIRRNDTFSFTGQPYIYYIKPVTGCLVMKEMDDDIDIRLRIALDSDLQENTLRQLSGSDDWNIRYGVARNLNTSQDILKKLSTDSDYRVRKGVAENWNTSHQILENLLKDNNLYVRWGVFRTMNGTIDTYAFSPEKDMDKNHYGKNVGGIPKTEKNVPYGIIKSKLENINTLASKKTIAIANEMEGESRRINPIEKVNRDKAREILKRLLEEENNFMEWEIAKDINTPEDVLAILAKNDDSEVRWSVAENLSTPQEVLKFLSTDRNENVRWIVSENPNTPQDILVSLAEDTNADVRWGVANNPNTPREILRRLSEDNEQNVRASAIKNLKK